MTDTSGTIAPEQISINGQEYSLEDAGQLVELGNKYKDLESKLNTSLDKVYPEYTKTTQRNKELERELEETKAQMTELATKQSKPSNPDRDSALKAAREIGLADQDYLKEQGYVRKEDLDEFFNTKQTQQKLVDNILAHASKLETEIDGSDGRVPFVSDAVLVYASAYNIADLQEAYSKMNERANAKWQAEQLAKVEPKGLTTLRGGGLKEPKDSKVTDDNFKAKWDEMFGGGNEG